MVAAPQIIALELGLRFLTDHLRGDSYFKLGRADRPDLNRARAMAQLTLFRRLRERADEAGRFIEDLKAEFLAPPPQAPERTSPGPHRRSPEA